MTEAVTHNLTIFADNFHFLLQDRKADCQYPETWIDEIASCMLAVGTNVVGVGTVRDLDVEVEIEVFDEPLADEELEPDLAEWDHVGQCSLSVPSGKVLVTGPSLDERTEESRTIELKPGNYGLRIYWSGLDTLDELGFEGEDRYKIQIWPDTYFEPRILKIWRTLELQLGGML